MYVGIDLGTTNTSIAFWDNKNSQSQVQKINQDFNAKESIKNEQIPSFSYRPLTEECTTLRFPEVIGGSKWTAGEIAKQKAHELPSRVVHSAKSWLSHSILNPKKAFLPVDVEESEHKISAADATTLVLRRVRDSWDADFQESPLSEQEVVITVPASFDAQARLLTEEIAKSLDINHLTLLEEPQAALYAWISSQGDDWRKQLTPGNTVLVIDIGGGTTDFSLIRVAQKENLLVLERVAVGEHILLGGDNMDLALAYRLKIRLENQGKEVDDWQFQSLKHSVRTAKEKLLNDPQKSTVHIGIASRKRKLFGGSLSVELSFEDVKEALIYPFFPVVEMEDSVIKSQGGLQSFGLPFASDAAITRHMAAFIKHAQQLDSSFSQPSHILFNGGVTNSAEIKKVIQEQLLLWSDDSAYECIELINESANLAVSKGAAYYAYSKSENQVRIRGGSTASYYVGVERTGMAIPGMPPQIDALCIAPLGMEEDQEYTLDEEFIIQTNSDFKLSFMRSNERADDVIGSKVNPKVLVQMNGIESKIESEQSFVRVKLVCGLTTVGTLNLSLVEINQVVDAPQKKT